MSRVLALNARQTSECHVHASLREMMMPLLEELAFQSVNKKKSYAPR